MSTTIRGLPAVRPLKLDSAAVTRFLQENAVFGETRRFRQLDRYEAHYRGTQYSHQEFDWWGRRADITETVSPDATVPDGFQVSGGPSPAEGLTVRDKRPTAPKNLAKTVTRRFTGLLLSDARRPRVSVEGDADTEDFLNAVIEKARFWSVMRAARNKGGAMGSVMVTAHVRDGKFTYEVHNSKHLSVVWKDRRTWTPLAVLKMYKYMKEIDVVDPKTNAVTGTREVPFLYRRIITDTEDIIYHPLNLEDVPDQGAWEVDAGLYVRHDLGYFPGYWIQNEADADDMDGAPDCDGAWQTLDTIDRLLAQMNKGVLLNVDPTPVIGTDPKEVEQGGGLRKGSDNALYVGKSGKADYMEMNGEAITVALSLLQELKQTVFDLSQCVIVDPEKLSGSAQSARAIEYIFEPMIERADDFRAQYGTAFVEILRITEEMARAFLTKKIPLPDAADGVPQIGQFRFDLPPRKVTTPDGKTILADHVLGAGGYIQIHWGPYFAPTETDNKQKIDNATAANAAGFIDKLTGAKDIAPLFGVQDVEGVLVRAREELEESAERAMAALDGGVRENASVTQTVDTPGGKAKVKIAPGGGDKKEDLPPPAGAGGKP